MSKMIVPRFNSQELRLLLKNSFLGKTPKKMLYIPNKLYRENDCYKNVEQEVKQHGGELVYGWSVWMLPNAFIEAYHHAVWRSPKRKLIDVSPDSTSDEKNRIFIEDQSAQFDDSMPRYNNKRFILTEDPLITEFFNTQDEYNKQGTEEAPGYFCQFEPSPRLLALGQKLTILKMELFSKY